MRPESLFRSIVVAMFTALSVGCSGAGQDSEEGQASTSDAYSVGLDGCTLTADVPGHTPGFYAPRAAGGTIKCPSWRNNIQLQVCMQQLVSGGWQTMHWTCTYTGTVSGLGVSAISYNVSYYTAGRWYRSWAWGDVNGANTAIVSAGCQGNGGSGCN
jgi:hypothetical protein